MNFWDFLLSAGSILCTAIITYIPLKYDMNKKGVHNTFLVFATLAVMTGVAATYNLWKGSIKADDNMKNQQEEFSKQITDLKVGDSMELSRTREYIIDSMTSMYRGEKERQRRQMDSIEASRQRKLTYQDMGRLIKRVNDIIKSNNLPTNTPISVNRPLGNEESRIYAREVYHYLKKKGYNLITSGNSIGDDLVGVTSGNESKGFHMFYYKQERYIFIDVGVLGNRP